MRNRLIIVILLSLISFGAYAGTRNGQSFRKFTFGAEWGFISSFHSGIHHNFFSEEGYRVDINQQSIGYESNGDVYLHCGYNINQEWNLSIYAGFAGVANIGNSIPLSLRMTRLFKEDKRGDRWLCYLDAGSGVCLKQNPQMIAAGKIGGGYRMALSRTTKMDFLLGYRMTLSHPDIVFDGYTVPFEMINRNNAYVSAIALSISLTF